MGYLKSKVFWEAAAQRAIRTFAQVFVTLCSSAVILEDISLKYSLSASAMAALLSIGTSIVTGLPEVEEEEE